MGDHGSSDRLDGGTVRGGKCTPRMYGRHGFAAGSASAADAEENPRHFARSGVEMMRGYTNTRDCRRGFLLNSFGETFAAHCGRCDACAAGPIVAPSPAGGFPLNSRVIHPAWGPGVVLRYERDTMVVLFETVGYRTLGVDIVREERLLAAG